MPHSLDLRNLSEVFAGLEADDGQHLTTWEMDRLVEWKALWERGHALTARQLEILEQMWLKVP